MKRLAALFAFTLMGAAIVPSSDARAVTVINGSFEQGTNPGVFSTLNPGDTDIVGWTVASGSIDYIGTYWTAADGSRSIDMNGLTAGSISQTISGLTIGHQYRVGFYIAGNPDAGPDIKTLGVTASANSDTFTFDISGATHAAMGWVPASFLFTADGSDVLLTFASLVTTGGTTQNPAAFGPALDNVSISETPIPAALPLFLTGLGLMGWLRRRRGVSA